MFGIAWLLIPFFILATAFVLVTFSRLRQVPQPKRSLLIGFGSGAITGLFWIPLVFAGGNATWLSLFVIGTTIVLGALIGPLGSAETLSVKLEDEFIRKSDDGSGFREKRGEVSGVREVVGMRPDAVLRKVANYFGIKAFYAVIEFQKNGQPIGEAAPRIWQLGARGIETRGGPAGSRVA